MVVGTTDCTHNEAIILIAIAIAIAIAMPCQSLACEST